MSERVEVSAVEIVETEVVVRETRTVQIRLVGRIVSHSPDWKSFELDASVVDLTLGDSIVVKYDPVVRPRSGSADVFAHLDNQVWLSEAAFWRIPAIADGDYVYRVEPA